MPTVAERLARAKAFHGSGRLPEAEQGYLEVLEADAGHVEALYLLGAARQALGRPLDAIQSLEQAIRLRPDYVDAHNYLGAVLARLGRLDEALVRYQRTVALRPDFVLAQQNLGSLWLTLNQPEAAAACYRAAIALKPDSCEAYNGLGIALRNGGHLTEAVVCYRQAIRLESGYFEAHNNLGVALMDANQLVEAVASYRQALALKADYAEAQFNLGVALARQAKHAEAVACYRRALELAPDFAEAYNALGIALIDESRLDEAEHCCRRAIALKPGFAEAHFCLGGALMEGNRVDEAIDCYAQAIAIMPDYARAHFGRALAWLAMGRFSEGWGEYQWRWKSRGQSERSLEQPLWAGAPLAGGTILLHSEQGLGDTLQFVRYAEMVKQRVGRVIVECQPSLVSLLASCPGVDRVFAEGGLVETFDVHAPLASLPGILSTTLETVPAQVPYLSPDVALVEHWKTTLGARERAFRVGIAWQGNVAHANDRARSIPLAKFDSLSRAAGVRLYSLQMGAGREQLSTRAAGAAIVDLGDRPPDFQHTAAIMSNLDLVIACDTAAVHLAGALGVPVWVALPFAADWRWMLERSDSPWYPTMRLFRQTRPGDWDGVFGRIGQELAKIA